MCLNALYQCYVSGLVVFINIINFSLSRSSDLLADVHDRKWSHRTFEVNRQEQAGVLYTSLPKFKPYLTVERNVSAQAVSSATVY